jgi:protein SCO1/2
MARHYVFVRGLLLACVCAALLGACGGSYTFRGTTLDPPSAAPDFTLTDHRGEPFRLSGQRGKVVLLYFGFTSCPDLCPTTLADLAVVRRELGADAEPVQVALITVDPERDTLERIGPYVTGFDPTFVGLRGTPAELAPILKAYGVTAIKRELPSSALAYTIDHSSFVYVIDQAGTWRALFSHGAAIDDMVSDVRYLVRNGGT